MAGTCPLTSESNVNPSPLQEPTPIYRAPREAEVLLCELLGLAAAEVSPRQPQRHAPSGPATPAQQVCGGAPGRAHGSPSPCQFDVVWRWAERGLLKLNEAGPSSLINCSLGMVSCVKESSLWHQKKSEKLALFPGHVCLLERVRIWG